MQWYTEQLFLKATSDATLHALCVKVMHLLRSPAAFYHPSVVSKVILGDRQKLPNSL
jgi:hypothetical protein